MNNFMKDRPMVGVGVLIMKDSDAFPVRWRIYD